LAESVLQNADNLVANEYRARIINSRREFQ